MKKINLNRHLLYTSKNVPKIKIALLSDIHFSKNVSNNFLDKILENLNKELPDIIFICGDLIDSSNDIINNSEGKRIIRFIEKIGKIAQCYISLGNHDVTLKIKSGTRYYYNQNFFNKINQIENVKILNNDAIIYKKIYIYGFNKDYKYYENESKYKLYLNNKASGNFSILLCHSPINLVPKNFDLILCGHMHNGMLPNFINKLIKNNIGLVGPNLKLFPKDARGTKKMIGGKMIISGGIIKLAKSSGIISHLAKIYKPTIEIIEIK